VNERVERSNLPGVHLIGPGVLHFEVAFGDPFLDKHHLSVDLVPRAGGVRLMTRKATASEWQSVAGTLSADQFDRFAARLTAAVATPPQADGSYDCGTWGAWVMSAEVMLPLSSGTVAARATEAFGFASLPVFEVVTEELERLAALPGSGAVTWASKREEVKRARRLRLTAIAAVLVLLLCALASVWQ